jgi:hypothetical protein
MNTKARINKKLVILGKAPVKGKQCIDAKVDFPDCEVWTVGTHKIKNADRYYEFHGLEVAGRKMVRDVWSEVKSLADLIPLNNSVSVMLAQAYFEGYTNIEILGSPMIARDEYIRQRAALAMCIGYIRGISRETVHIEWPEEPEKLDYFERYQK